MSTQAARQSRAERLATRFKEIGRKPIVFEFAGVPKAGKTTTLTHLQAFLKRCGFRVEVVVERASVCPIRDKKHSNFNVWTACTTLAHLLEKTQVPPKPDDPDILFLDRGLFDSLCWLHTMVRLSRLREDELEAIETFLQIDDWRRRISAVFVMIASPADSMEREQGYLPVDGARGSIMNPEVLTQTLETTQALVDQYGKQFPIHVVDTSSKEPRMDPQQTVEKVADLAMDVIEGQLKEEILCLERSDVLDLFSNRVSLKVDDTAMLLGRFVTKGTFLPREPVEVDEKLVQALSVVIVRNKSGDVLVLKRNEVSGSNPLHGKLVIWAGGHVRSEDSVNGEAILKGAVRELHEELRLSIEPPDLRLLGAVYVSKGERTSKHVAVVYEWRAETDEVAVALSNAEFFERRGNSLSGRFVSIENLIKDVETSKLDEVWSTEILRQFLAPNADAFKNQLF